MRFSIGDVFEVPLDSSTTGYFQYVARDQTQLSSHVVRVFKGKYAKDDPPDVTAIVESEVDFYAHVFLSIGVKLNFWRRVAKGAVIGDVDVMFRNSNDYGKNKRATSSDWYVWTIGEPFVHVGALSGVYRSSEIGIVVAPDSLVHRMRNGSYDFVSPEPE